VFNRLAVVLLLLLVSARAEAGLRLAAAQDATTVTLQWDPPPETVIGYTIGFGTQSGTYTQTFNVGLVTTATVNLPTSALYYFAVRAFDATGNSEWSNEVSTGTAPPPATGGPTLRTVAFTSDTIAGSSTVLLTWDTTPLVPVSGYKIYAGQSGSRVYSATRDVGLVSSGTITVATPSLPTTFYFAITSYIVGTPFQESGFSNELTAVIPAGAPPPPPPPSQCDPPFGNRVVTLTITTFKRTIDAAGALAYVDYLTTSPNAPVRTINLLLNGKLWRTGGGSTADLTMFGRVWFNLPTVPGSYTVSLEALNGTCTAVQTKDASGQPIVVVVK
jgi:hypothetical protein